MLEVLIYQIPFICLEGVLLVNVALHLSIKLRNIEFSNFKFLTIFCSPKLPGKKIFQLFYLAI